MKNRKTMNTTVVPIEARGNKSKVNPKSPEDFSRGPKKNPVIERKTTPTPINNRKGAPVERVDRFQIGKDVSMKPGTVKKVDKFQIGKDVSMKPGTVKKVDKFQIGKDVTMKPGKKTVNNNPKVNLRNNK
jgi:hypothetical protein